MEKLLHVLGDNLGYTVVLILAIVLFCIFSNGLIAGLITAFSAVIAYACILALARAYKATGTAPAKKPNKKKSK